MNRFFSILISLCSFLNMESQNWDSIKGGLPNDVIEKVLYDSVHNELIVSSKFLTKIGSLPVRGLARWNGTRWDSLAGGVNTHDKIANPNNPGANISSCIPYNGKLLVAGGFISIGGIPATGLATWDGVKWDSLPKRAFRFNIFGGVNCAVKRCNGKIYVYGQFDSIAGKKASGLAIWDGSDFNPIPVPYSDPSNGVVSCVEGFQSNLYITGGYFTIPGTYTNQADVLKYNGTNWSSTTGTGILSSFGNVSPLTVYNNELYVAGHFLMSAGDKGNNIMKFNGTQWQDIGFGPSPDYIRDIVFHNNNLYAIGCYYQAAFMPCFSIAKYDGTKWCALQDTVDNCLNSGTIFNDTVYIGGAFWKAGGDPKISYLAKLKNENLYRNCNGVGIKESIKINEISFYPNPVLDILHIESEKYFEVGTEIEITNVLGQLVLMNRYHSEIDLSQLSKGYYVLKIITPDKQQFQSKFIKE